LSTIQRSNSIAVIKGGKVVEQGSHNENYHPLPEKLRSSPGSLVRGGFGPGFLPHDSPFVTWWQQILRVAGNGSGGDEAIGSFAVLFWELWKAKNLQVFEGQKTPAQVVMDLPTLGEDQLLMLLCELSPFLMKLSLFFLIPQFRFWRQNHTL
ncbi:hypothetical protein HN51_035466, partial [Arachis hypogaea]